MGYIWLQTIYYSRKFWDEVRMRFSAHGVLYKLEISSVYKHTAADSLTRSGKLKSRSNTCKLGIHDLHLNK